MTHSLDRLPSLAGILPNEAARIGYSVDENVRRLVRLHWAERRMMLTMISRLPGTPEWEVKCAFALHQWYAAEHADRLAARIVEMRNPAPKLDGSPDGALDRFFDELMQSPTTAELVAGLYHVARPAISAAYAEHRAYTNPLVDHPTRRLMQLALVDDEETLAWRGEACEALTSDDPDAMVRTREWTTHLHQLLVEAGGMMGAPYGDVGDSARRGDPPTSESTTRRRTDHHHSTASMSDPALDSLAPAHSTSINLTPHRDSRFAGLYNFEFPPHVVYNLPNVPADERNLALLCKRALEMDVPEMMATFIAERPSEPWEFYHDYSRQLWDEARHAMMGTVGLEALGVDWKTEIPLNISFALRLGQHATPLERQTILYAIEQSLMPAETGKRFEYETAVAAGDALSRHFHDYDWADEVLHAQIGRRMLKRDGVSRELAIERAVGIHERTWAALDAYRDREKQSGAWWTTLVRKVLGHDPAVPPEELGAPTVISE